MGKQDWWQDWCQGSRNGNALEPCDKPGTRPKWLKFILILSNCLCHPVLNTLVTLFISPSFTRIFFQGKILFLENLVSRTDRGQGTWGWKRPSQLAQPLTDLFKTWCTRNFWRTPSPKSVTTGVSKLGESRSLTLSMSFPGTSFGMNRSM
jgi:hypothetical protein